MLLSFTNNFLAFYIFIYFGNVSSGNALLIPGAYALFTQKMNLIILKKLGKEFSHYISIFYITADSFIVK
jgi:hypothetical protein